MTNNLTINKPKEAQRPQAERKTQEPSKTSKVKKIRNTNKPSPKKSGDKERPALDEQEASHTPSTAGTFRKKFWKNSERPPKRSQSFSWNSSPPVRLGTPLFSEVGWGRLFFQKWFCRGPLRTGHGIPRSTGGRSLYYDCWNGNADNLPADMKMPHEPKPCG